MRITARGARGVVGGVVVAVMFVAACGSSSKPATSSSTTTASGATSDTCQALNDFKTSISSLTSPATLSGGKDSVNATIDQAQSDLDKLKSDLKSADKPQVDALQSSVDDLKTAVSNVNGLSGVNTAIDAGQKVLTNANSLLQALKAGCPSS